MRQVSVPPAPTIPADKTLTLTVSLKGRVYPSRELAAHLGLKHGQRIDLVPPRGQWNSGQPWHLDIREGTPLASLTVFVNGEYKPQFQCCQVLSPARFRYRNQQLSRLTLALAEPVLIPGFLPMYPVYVS